MDHFPDPAQLSLYRGSAARTEVNLGSRSSPRTPGPQAYPVVRRRQVPAAGPRFAALGVLDGDGPRRIAMPTRERDAGGDDPEQVEQL
jgi:hypothetical protein